MASINVANNKVLKLTNLLSREIDFAELDHSNEMIDRMYNYVKTKGACSVGPLIQYIEPQVGEQSQMSVKMLVMCQCNTQIHSLEQPYKMNSLLRVTDCMYCRYIGPEENLKLAYDKLNVTAFEQNIKLKGSSYTVFVDRNDENENITADIFMEKSDE